MQLEEYDPPVAPTQGKDGQVSVGAKQAKVTTDWCQNLNIQGNLLIVSSKESVLAVKHITELIKN